MFVYMSDFRAVVDWAFSLFSSLLSLMLSNYVLSLSLALFVVAVIISIYALIHSHMTKR